MQQFVICKNDFPEHSLPLGTSEETANQHLADIKKYHGTETSQGQNIYWHLQTVELLLNKPKINIQKHKTSGKYQDEYEIALLPDEISEDGKTALMFKISDRVKQLESEHLRQGGFVRITVEDIGYPCLLHNIVSVTVHI